MSKIRVLFLCTGNSARSQMAESILRHHAGERFDPYSAGFEPKAIDPLVLEVLQEKGFPTEGLHPKPVTEFLGKMHFGYLITLCQKANDLCPKTFPDVSVRLHWGFDDPVAADGSREERLQVFRNVRDGIEKALLELISLMEEEES